MKVIAFYLPQYHSIPENDKWWGKGFTEWSNVKKGKPLFDGHYQPRRPFDNNYYNLLNDEVKKWQVKLAKEYGITGFCFYHYWFDGHMLLEKPVEQYLKNKELDLPFCICWANEDWTNIWKSDGDTTTLIAQTYGEKKDWIAHFTYLLPFLKDQRYICENGKPLIIIYRPEIIPCLDKMLECWLECARKAGLEGITFAYQTRTYYDKTNGNDKGFDLRIEYQPNYVFQEYSNNQHKILYPLYRWIKSHLLIKLKHDFILKRRYSFKKYSYDELWEMIINKKPKDIKSIPGAFVDWDNTSRKGLNGSVVCGATPEKFGKYFSRQIKHAKNDYKKDYIFIFAWNEWSESGYLEPDEKYKTGYLEALKNALIENGEFEGVINDSTGN